MIEVDRLNALAGLRVGAKARGLIAVIARGNFDCGQAFEGSYSEYMQLYEATMKDETALLEYIAELEEKVGVAP